MKPTPEFGVALIEAIQGQFACLEGVQRLIAVSDDLQPRLILLRKTA